MNRSDLEPRRLLCPDDGSVLRQPEGAPTPLATCHRCAGIWLPGDSVHARGRVELPVVTPTRRRREPARSRQCPECGKPMRVRDADGVSLDVCSRCDGVWIEPGEHEAARKLVKQLRIARAVPWLGPVPEPLKPLELILDVLGWLFIDFPDSMSAPLESPDPRSYIPTVPREPVVVPYRPEFRAAFESLNRRWIERYFAMEPRDEAVFRDPEAEVLANGGEIFFLITPMSEAPVGTCALMHTGNGVYYLTKMAVDPLAQGRGFGERLLVAAIEWAKSRRATQIDLTSNRVLAPAIALYRKHGFVEVPLAPSDAEYVRVDIRMTLRLQDRSQDRR